MERESDILLSEEQIALREIARRIARNELAEISLEWDLKEEVDWDYLAKILGSAGFVGMTVPEEHGGAGASFLDFVIVMEELCATSFPAALMMQATCSGPPMHIIELGSQELKEEVLPRIVRDASMCAVAMTEADAGSDLGNISTSMVADGDEFIINGTKMYVGGSGHADYYVTYARETSAPGTDGLGCILVPKDTPGVMFGRPFEMLGPRPVPRRELIFNDCRVPARYVLAHAGDFKKMINTFNTERLHNSAMNLGMAQGAFDHARAYAQERVTFGRPLSERQGIQWKLAEMHIHLEAMRWLIYGAARMLDNGEDIGMACSVAKYYSAEYGFDIADKAMQIEGAVAIQHGIVQVAFRNIRSARIAAGSTEMMLNYIGRHVARSR